MKTGKQLKQGVEEEPSGVSLFKARRLPGRIATCQLALTSGV